MEMMEELDMTFEPSGQTLAADGENKAKVSEGIQAINDLIDFKTELARRDQDGKLVPDPSQAPHAYVLEHCENIIWCLENYTGLDGQHGAGKDPVDTLRYFAICDPINVPEDGFEMDDGGSY
jgi:hypothetical protein